MRYSSVVFLVFISVLLAGCGSAVPKMKPFKMEIQQGNVVTSKMLLQLRPGMTKSQVKFIMGTPLIADSFHSNRWDYFYQMRQSGKVVEQRRVILDFEKELLVRVRGDVVPKGTPGAEPAQDGNSFASAKSVNPTPVKQAGLLEKLKFWKNDEKSATNSAAKPKEDKGLFDSLKFWKKDEVAETKEVNTVTDTKPAEASPSLLAVPVTGAVAAELPSADAPAEKSIIATPTIAEPAMPEAKTVEPAAEPAKLEAEVPKQEAAKMEAVKVEEAPKPEPEIASPAIATPAVQTISESSASPQQAKNIENDGPFIFRMDKKLNLKNLEAAPVMDVKTKMKPKAIDTPAPEPEEAPGYFERILEKIGF